MKDSPVKALWLVRVAVGLFFALFGAMKLFMMGPSGTAAMMSGYFGTEGMLSSLLAWVTIVAELGGGLVVLMGCTVPKTLYKLSLLAFIAITVVGFGVAHVGTENMIPQLLWHLQLVAVTVALLITTPRCCSGVTGVDK